MIKDEHLTFLISLLNKRPDSSFLEQDSSGQVTTSFAAPYTDILKPIERLSFGEIGKLNSTNRLLTPSFALQYWALCWREL